MASNPTDAAAPHDEDPLGPNNPFPGLRPYRECDADWFFGRDQEINDLLRKLRHAHFLAVVGPSGCGKSSLIRAGVLRSLHDGFLNAEWSVAEFRPGGGPIQELSKALATALGRNLEPAALRRGPGAIVDTVRAAGLSERVRVLIFADQFEELFRYEDDGGQAAREETKAFLKLLLAAAISDEAPIYVAITMRMEYLKRCAGYLGFAEAINEGVYLVPQMTRRQFRQAIVNPIGKAGAAITAALIDRLLNDLDGQTDQLPVLEHALLRMWGPEENRRALDLPQYKAIGTLSDCLSQHVGKVYQDLPPEQRLLTERLFRSITEVTPENQRIRRPRTLDKVCRMLHTDIESVWPVVEAFTAAGRHFLVTSPAPPPTESTVIDISHEALLRQWTTLREWLDTEAELRLEKRSVEDAAAGWIKQRSGGFWRRVFKSPSFLYRGLNLKLALRTEPFLSDDGRRFLKACRRNRFWRRLATGSVVAAVLVAAAWIGGNYRSERLLIQANINWYTNAISTKSDAGRQEKLAQANAALAVRCAVVKGCSSETLSVLSKAVWEVKKPTVFLQIGNASQKPCAKLIQNRLSDFYLTPAIEAVRNPPAHTEVRYFHDGDAKAAGDLAAEIKSLADLTKVDVKPIRGFEFKVTGQQFEVWFSSDLTCAAMDTLNFESMVQGVKEVVSSNASGPVLPKSREWAVIVAGDDASAPAFVAARQAGTGRVVAVGHEWLLLNVVAAYRDNAVFVSNLIGWLDVKKRKRVAYTAGHREWLLARPLDDLTKVLGQRQFTVRKIPGAITAAALADSSVLIVGNAWGDFSEDEIAAVQSFVARRGGLLLAGLGWSWVGYNPGKTINDYPMTKMAKPYEIGWLDSVIATRPVAGLADSGLFTRFYPQAR